MARMTCKEKSSFKFWFDEYVKTEEDFKLRVYELYVSYGCPYVNIKSIVRHNYRNIDINEIIEILKEFDVKRCGRGKNCKCPNGCVQSRDNFYDKKSANDGKINQCVYCQRFDNNFKYANKSKQNHMLEFQEIEESDKQDEFLVNLYRKGNYDYQYLASISLRHIDDVISLLEKHDVKKCSRGEDCKSPDGCVQSRNNFNTNKFMNDGKNIICKYCDNFNQVFKRANQTKQNHMLEFQKLESDKQDEFLVGLYKNGYEYRDLTSISLRHMDDIINLLKKHDIKRCGSEKNCKSPDGSIQSLDNFYDNKNTSNGKSVYCIYCQQSYHIQPGKYNTYASQLETFENVRRDPNNPDLIQVKCKYSGCNKWFNPTNMQIQCRISAINGKAQSVGTENHFYCSESCKDQCSLYNLQSDPNTSSKSSNSERMQIELRQYVIKIRNPDRCEGCGKKLDQKDLILHHKIPVADNYMLEADLDNLMFLCQTCHNKAHQKDGCRLDQLREYKKC